jgi:hypothetical protein
MSDLDQMFWAGILIGMVISGIATYIFLEVI